MPPHDLSRCHDEQCIRAKDCWRYTSRIKPKWASHVLTMRPVGDSGEHCNFFIQDNRQHEERD